MAIQREELYEKGRAFYRQRFNTGGAAAIRTTPVIVMEVMRGAAKVKDEKTGREFTTKFSELEPDHDWLDQRDREEEEKQERIARESRLPAETKPHAPVVRLVEQSKPLTATFAELLAGQVLKGKTEPAPPPSMPAPAPLETLTDWPELRQPKEPAPTAPVQGPGDEEDEDEREDEEEEIHSRTGTGQRIYDLRIAKGWAQTELARKCVVTGASISQWEWGITTPQQKSLAKLAKAFGVHPDVVEGIKPIPEGYGSGKPSQLSMQHSGVYARIDTAKPKVEPKPHSTERLPTQPRTQWNPEAPVEPGMAFIPGKRTEPEPESVSHAGEICEPPPLEATSIMPVPKAGFDMWLEMGRRMREPLQSEIAQLEATIKPLEQRLLDMMARKDEVQEQLAALDSMLSKRPKAQAAE